MKYQKIIFILSLLILSSTALAKPPHPCDESPAGSNYSCLNFINNTKYDVKVAFVNCLNCTIPQVNQNSTNWDSLRSDLTDVYLALSVADPSSGKYLNTNCAMTGAQRGILIPSTVFKNPLEYYFEVVINPSVPNPNNPSSPIVGTCTMTVKSY